MADLNVFSQRLREARIAKGYSQAELADEAGVTAATISSYENATTSKKSNTPKFPSIDKVILIAEKLEVSIDWLCGLELKKTETTEENYYRLSAILYCIEEFLQKTNCGVNYNRQDVNNYVYTGSFINCNVEVDNYFIADYLNKRNNFWKAMTSGENLDYETYALCINGIIKKYDDIYIKGKKSYIKLPNGEYEEKKYSDVMRWEYDELSQNTENPF